jgi:hypothetical protein
MNMIEPSAAVEHLDSGPRSKDELAAAVAAAIPPGSYVNLGIGQPTTVADYLTPESQAWCYTPRTACSTWDPPLALIRSTQT